MNVVDSSGWLEYFADGPNADFFAPAIEERASLVVPAVTIYEVFKRVCAQRNEGQGLQAVAQMQQGLVVLLDAALALEAARLSLQTSLPMADAMILAAARRFRAMIWTQDADFEGLPDVRYIRRTNPGRI